MLYNAAMKRSDFYIKLTTAVFFVAVICYLGVYVYNAMLVTYETTPAIIYAVEQTVPARGYIVRSEFVLTDSGNVVLPIVGEGEKVASGQSIAVEYMSTEALEAASEIRALRLMIEQQKSVGDEAAVEAASLKTVMDLSKAVQLGDFSRIDELSLNIETGIFTESVSPVADLQAMTARLEALESRVAGVNTIDAPVSGVFSQAVDGFEHIEPAMLFNIAPAELRELFGAPSRIFGVGKLITDFKWYYAALIDAADVLRLKEAQNVTIRFSGAYSSAMEMLVEYVGKQDNDECVVLFSSTRSVHDITPLRELRADAVLEVFSGIRVPKEAIHLDDEGKTFVYLQTGIRAERVSVEILTEFGDSYLVRSGAESGTPLREGSTIIVKANDLFDGKIVA